MLKSLRENLLTNWHPLRWVALGIGLIAGYNWLVGGSALLGFMSLFFLFQAVTNTGCLGGHCSPALAKMSKNDTDEIEFEEIDTVGGK